MKKLLFTALIVLLATGTAGASVILDYVKNASPGPGLKSFNVRAKGIGIVTLSQFTIEGNVNQEFLNPSTQSPWLADGTADPLGTGRDSYIAFGDLRMPDLAGTDGPGNGTPIATTETILDGSAAGPGTLNNLKEDGEYYTWDAYLKTGVPLDYMKTYSLFNLVLADGETVDLALTLYTATDYDPNTGMSTVTRYDLNLYSIPEPGFIVMLLAAGLCLVGYRLRECK